MYDHGQWNDIACHASYQYICKQGMRLEILLAEILLEFCYILQADCLNRIDIRFQERGDVLY